MSFPLEVLASAVQRRTGTWAALGLQVSSTPIVPNHGKACTSFALESPDWLIEVVVWVSGEAELSTIRRADARIVNKHYDLTGPADLEVLLDELVGPLARDRIPDAAVVVG